MATLIDELILAIGLDPSGFHEGRRRLDDEMARSRQTLETFGKNVEASGHKISEVFSMAKRGVAGLLGAFIGGEAAAFIDHIATMDARTMQLAHSIGISTHELSIWQNMVRTVGGTAGDASAAFAGLNDAFMGMRMGNQMPSTPFAALMSRAGIDWRHGSPGQALGQTMQFLQGQSEQNQRFWLQQIPGVGGNENMMFLLMEIMRHPDKMRNLREELEKIGVATEKSGEAALDFAEKSGALQTALEQLARSGFPVLTAIVNSLTEFLQQFQGPEGWRGGVKKLLNPDKGTANESFLERWSEATFNMMFGQSAPKADVERKIRQSFSAQGINPEVALRVARGESGLDTTALGDKVAGFPTSFGVFQLHLGGLAGPYTKSTGHDPADPQYWQDQVDFAAKWVKEHGWGDFHAHKGDPWEGITRGGVGKQSSVVIHNITVSSNKADPKAVADQIPAAIERYAMLGGINTGLS